MAEKKTIKRGIKRLQAIKTWQLVVILLLLSFVAATFLRLNNTGMVARRAAVLAADKAGNEQDMAQRLYDLHRYAGSHMNANSGVFYLQGQYDRDVKKATQAAASSSSSAARAHADAEAVCRPQFTGYSTAYLQCFIAELAKHPSSDKLPEVKTPDPKLYRYDFISPLWAADFAGWTVLLCVGIAFVIVARLISLVVLRILLRRHYRSV